MRIINPMETLIIIEFLCPDCKRNFDALLDGEVEEITYCPECSKKMHAHNVCQDHVIQRCKNCIMCNGHECIIYGRDPKVATKKCAEDNFTKYITREKYAESVLQERPYKK